MQIRYHLPIVTLLLLISFASINAVLFTPALPSIAQFFAVDAAHTQLTLSYYLMGYALGQLLYGPLANRYGRKPTLYFGISIAALSSLLCASSGFFHSFTLLLVGRFFLALGAGCGLKMTFTLVNECYPPKLASRTIAYLITAFAIIPGIGVAIGGFLTQYFGWESCFYASVVYSLLLTYAVSKLPETLTNKDYQACQLTHLVQAYGHHFRQPQLVLGGLVMGSCTVFVYVFAALAPFVAINVLHMSSAAYGTANLLPSVGMLMGSLFAAYLANRLSLPTIMKLGLSISFLGTVGMVLSMLYWPTPLLSLFLPMATIYFGACLVISNASTLALANIPDKAHGSAVFSFLNVGFTTLVVMLLSYIKVSQLLLPTVYLSVVAFMVILFYYLMPRKKIESELV